MNGNKKWILFLVCSLILVGCNAGKKNDKESGQPKTEIMKQEKVGADKDEHGCIASAGYTWSEVQQSCIRLFEKGIRLNAIEGGGSSFIVFSLDSTKAELFFSGDEKSEILERRSLPSGGFAWNIEDDDTKNVRLIDGAWTISQRGKVFYRQDVSENDSSLGKLLIRTYEGVLPAADCPGICYTLVVRNREYSGDGTFSLVRTYLEAEDGKDQSFTDTGKRFTLRGIPGDPNATVWQLVPEGNGELVNLLYENDSTLTLLNQNFERSKSNLNYNLMLVK